MNESPIEKFIVFNKQNFVVGLAFNEVNTSIYKSIELPPNKIEIVRSALRSNPKKIIKIIDGEIITQTRSITKRELVDKLIAINKAAEFNSILNALPLDEKLRWEASPTIAPEYPYIAENKAQILTALQITEDQFISIFQ